MNTLYAYALGQAHKNDPLMVFNWDKAAGLILVSGFRFASAGLLRDWENTGGLIFADGEPKVSDSCYLRSVWALPMLVLHSNADDCDEDEARECWVYWRDAPGWENQWPASALAILRGGAK